MRARMLNRVAARAARSYIDTTPYLALGLVGCGAAPGAMDLACGPKRYLAGKSVCISSNPPPLRSFAR